MMKNMMVMAMVIGMMVLGGFAAVADEAAQAADKATEVFVVGTVSVVADEAGAVTAVTITAENGVYAVAGDKAAELAKMAGKKVKTIGTVTEKDGAKSVAVRDYEALD